MKNACVVMVSWIQLNQEKVNTFQEIYTIKWRKRFMVLHSSEDITDLTGPNSSSIRRQRIPRSVLNH